MEREIQQVAFPPIPKKRKRVAAALMDRITAMALQMPPHTVVPYPNVPRREYPRSK